MNRYYLAAGFMLASSVATAVICFRKAIQALTEMKEDAK